MASMGEGGGAVTAARLSTSGARLGDGTRCPVGGDGRTGKCDGCECAPPLPPRVKSRRVPVQLDLTPAGADGLLTVLKLGLERVNGASHADLVGWFSSRARAVAGITATIAAIEAARKIAHEGGAS